MRYVFALLLLCLPSVLLAQPSFSQPPPTDQSNYLAQIELHTISELHALLQRTDTLFNEGQLDRQSPVVFVLHGDEGRVFMKDSYQMNKEVVDLAARLTAFQAVDIRVCETWMGSKGLDKTGLQPFVDSVPVGPAEVIRLIEEEQYSYF